VQVREIKRLETDTNFVATIAAPPGTYSSITVGFANPVITFLNRTNNTVSGCTPAKPLCQVTLAPIGNNITVSKTPPFPLILAAGKNPGIRLDFNFRNAITTTTAGGVTSLNVDFTQPNVLNAKLMPLSGVAPGVQDQVDDVVGLVRSVAGAGPSTFNVFSSTRGESAAALDSRTAFDNFPLSCRTNIACIALNQLVSTDLFVRDDSSIFLAKEIDLLDPLVTDQVEGTIVSVDSATQFTMVVTDIVTPLAGTLISPLNLGDIITVRLSNPTLNPTFVVDTKDIPPNQLTVARATFEGAADTGQLVPGQTVQVHVKSFIPATVTPPATAIVTTDKMRLRFTRVTATVSLAGSSLFNITGLPGFFSFVPGAQLQVQTSLQTTFENVAGVSALAVGDIVSIRALLFKSSAPNFFADKVRKH
jgi:hypothetical protein